MTQDTGLGFWSVDQLESIPNCPVCGECDRELLHHGMTDRVFRVAPGEWTLYLCRECRSAWLDPRPTPESLGKAYVAYYTHEGHDHPVVRRQGVIRTFLHDALNGYMNARYCLKREPSLKIGAWLVPLFPPLKTAVDAECRHMPQPPADGGMLLDVGCGNGRFLMIAKEMGWQGEGIDLDPIAVQTASRRGLAVRQGGIDLLQDVSERYDVVTLSHVIEHVYDPLDLLRQLYRLLKPGGRLWLETPNLESFGHARYGSAWRGLEPPRHLILFNYKSLADLVRRAGFSDIQWHWRGLILYSVFAASEAIQKMSPDVLSASRRGKPPVCDLVFEFAEMLIRKRREFITLSTSKK